MIVYGYIYETKNLVNGMMYIGRALGEFTPRYFGSGKYLTRAIRKYGKNAFLVRCIHRARNETNLNRAEMQYIHTYRIKFGRKSMYNLQDGGHRGVGYK